MAEDSKSGVCLFYQRTGTCKNGDHCPLSHVQEQRGITTRYDDRIWQSAQASTSGATQQQHSGRSKHRQKGKEQQQADSDQQQTQWDFRVMTYNILAEGLATAHGELLYQQVPAWCLKWEYRWPGLLAEIAHYKPDVMSLQEVDHMEQLASRLEPLGYEGRYAQRSGGRSDGCATFWRKDVFVAVAVDIIRFQSYGLQDNVALLVLLHRKTSFADDGASDAISDGVVEVRMTVDESGDVSMLSGEVQKWFTLHAELPVETLMDPALLIANTHILFNPKRGDIKIAQLRTLLNVMNDIVRKCNGNALGMVMGDFNSTPQSAVYHFIKAGELDCQTVPRKHVSGQVQGTSWPAALEKMARQRSAPAALSIPVDRSLITPPATPNSPQKSDFWGSPPRKSPTHRNPRKKHLSGSNTNPTQHRLSSSTGMKHVASEPQLMALGSGEFGGMAKETVQPVKLTAHTVPALQTLPDDTPPLASAINSPPEQPHTAPAAATHSSSSSLSQAAAAASAAAAPPRHSVSLARGVHSPKGHSPPTPKPLDADTADIIAKAVHTDDASLLSSVLPSIKSSMHSVTSLSTIAESASSPECSTQDLAALDQVAERLCELSNELASQPSQSKSDIDSEASSVAGKLQKDQSGSGTFHVSASANSLDRQALAPRTAYQTDASEGLATQASDASSDALANVPRAIPRKLLQSQSSSSRGLAGLALGAQSEELSRRSYPSSVSHNSEPQDSQADDSGTFEGFEARRLQPTSSSQSRRSLDADSAPSTASEGSTPAIIQCQSGRHRSPFIADRLDVGVPQDQILGSPGTVGTSEQHLAQQDPGHLILPRDAEATPDVATHPAPNIGIAAAGEPPTSPPELGRLSPRPPVHPVRPPSPGVRPLSPPPLPPVLEGEQAEILSPTSQLAKDIGLFSPRRLPPKLTNTRIGDAVAPERRTSLERRSSLERRPSLERRSGEFQRPFGDAFRSSGDGPRASVESGRSGPSPRTSFMDNRPPVVMKPLFRDDSCTWSPEQLKMAVGFPAEDLAEPSLTRADSAGTPGSRGSTREDPEPTWVARHPLKLRSAYHEVTGGEPPYTTCHSKFLGTVDYMWYTPNADKGTTLLPTRTLVPPPLEHLYCGLPSPEWQSDHMSLVTDFSVQRKSSKNSVLLSGLHKEANMVRARSKLVDSEVFAAALAAVNQDRQA